MDLGYRCSGPDFPIAVPVGAGMAGGGGRYSQDPPLNASKLQICRRHRNRDSANPNSSSWGNQGCAINPSKGTGR